MLQNTFREKIDGYKLKDLMKKLDYTVTSLEGRQKIVDEILSASKYFEIYFDNYFKSNLSSSDFLSDEVNVTKALDVLATYLLNSDEIKAEETEYKFFRDEDYFNKKMNRELSVEKLSTDAEGNRCDKVLHFLQNDDKTIVKKDYSIITEEDLQADNEMGKTLRQYATILNSINRQLLDKDREANDRFILTRAKNQITNDMYDVKRSYSQTVDIHKKLVKSESKYNFDFIDYTNEKHVSALITIPVINLDDSSELSFLMNEFDTIVQKSRLTENENNILELLRLGMKKIDIAKELGFSHVYITNCTKNIIKKITFTAKYNTKA